MKKKRNNIIALCMTICGIIALWVGMIFAFGNSAAFHPSGIVIAFVGLLSVVFAYPIHIASDEEECEQV